MSAHEIIFLITFVITIMAAIGGAIWYDCFRKPEVKPRIAICKKCRYVIKKPRIGFRGREVKYLCCTPTDMVKVDCITGKKEYAKYQCVGRNERGACPQFKRRWLW
jgi:hypothetical protein